MSLQVQVKDQQRDANGKADNQPVAGVSVTVLDAAGNEIATAVTDDKGIALIPVPGKADYTVQIDEDTLPDGLELSAETPNSATVSGETFTTNKKIVNFFTGQSQRVDRTASRRSRSGSPTGSASASSSPCARSASR